MSKEKQIEEMSVDLAMCHTEFATGVGEIYTDYDATAQKMFAKGYRKQKEGENVATYPSSAFECSNCHWQDWDLLTADSAYNFCPNCGAKMKGGAE